MREENITMEEQLALARTNGEITETPQFDVDRVAKELDEIFQVVLKSSLEVFEGKSDAEISNFKKELTKSIEEYKAKIAEIFPNIKDELLAEIAKGRTVLELPQGVEINIQHMDHPKLESVIKSLHYQRKAMLVGPAGTGKTFMIAQVAEKLNIPFYKYSCSRDSSVHDLLGYKQPASETYLETAFLRAYEYGGVFLVDEYDAMSGDMALFFNGIADSSKFISIPHRDDKPTAEKHEDFYLVMCGNTWGKGSTDYSGRDFQDMALMDRFRFCRHHIGYHTLLEKDLMGDNYDFALKLRSSLEQVGSYLSTRNIEDIANLISSGTNMPDIIAMLTQDLGENDSNNITNRFKNSNFAGDRPKIITVDGQNYEYSKLKENYPPGNNERLEALKNASLQVYEAYMAEIKRERDARTR